MLKTTQEIKDLVQEHRNAVAKISDLEKEIQNLKITKESLQIQIETQLRDLNLTKGGRSDAFDATFTIDGVSSISIIDFCEERISRVGGIVHYNLAQMVYED
jgi:hypothetical protein